MIVPNPILNNLKCSNCADLLSYGPVLIKQDGSNICGRCSNLEETAVPNKPYNELAEMCMFPCKYEAEGCNEKILFSSMEQHEADCEFRTYICPVMESGTCEWIGPRNKILEHTREVHPEKILEHPCEMEHDVKTASLKTFLMTAFDVLFLIHVKVCFATYTIYHSVRKIGGISDEHVFKYQLNIENENGSLMRKRDVAPQGFLALQEDSSIAVEIDSLIKALNGFENTKFTVTLQEWRKCRICQMIKIAAEIDEYDNINNIYCKTCSTNLVSCGEQDCNWKGLVDNELQHLVFCNYNKWCDKCDVYIVECNMFDHLRNENHTENNFNHLFGKYYSAHRSAQNTILTISSNEKSCILLIIKRDNLRNTAFYILNRENDVKIQCVLILRNPKTKHVLHWKMNRNYNFDWELTIHDGKLKHFMHDNIYEIGLDIYSPE